MRSGTRGYTRTQHFTRNTLEATAYCKRCVRFTRHQVSGGVITHCLECQARRAEAHANSARPLPAHSSQGNLFTRRNV
jgi:hypothetical protein